MSGSMPMRVDGGLFDAAKSIGAVASRSAAQQFSHWAHIGRELEASPGLSVRDIQRVLAGEEQYDALGERDQAVVRASWYEQVAARLAQLNLANEFTEAGRSWTEVDEHGAMVSRCHQVENLDAPLASPAAASTPAAAVVYHRDRLQ